MSEENKSDLIEYAQNNNSQPISGENGYNDTDAVVFSTLEYLKFENIEFNDSKEQTLENYIEKYLKYAKENPEKAKLDPNKKALAEAVKNNPRYKDLKIENVQASFSKDEPEQFAAMTVVLPEGQKVTVFRGTDGTNSGWWEDLCFGYNNNPEGTTAQKMAKEYIENITGTDEIYITGHSKGGGLTEWSALLCGYKFDEKGNIIGVDDEVRKKIKSVISLDGPGPRNDILKKLMKTPEYKELMEQVGDNWYTIVPPESVVGYIMTDPRKYKIVQSNAYSTLKEPFKVVFQHDTFTWLFKDDHINCGDINSGETGLFSQFMNDVLDGSIALIPRGMLEKVSDTGFELTGGILDDKILNYFEELKKAFDDSWYQGKVKLEEGEINVLETSASLIYTLAVIKEEIKINLEKTAVKYGIEKLKEGIEYGGKILKAFEKWCEEGVENLIDKAKDIWDYVGLKLSDMLKDEETKESCYISVGCCLISGISIIEKALCAITYVTVNNVVRITKDKFIKALNKLIDNMCIDNKALNFILSINGLEKIKGAVKFIKLVELVGIKIDQYINEISLYTCGKKASEMSVSNIAVCNGNGQIGIEYNLVPEINKVIDNVVNNLNKSISESLNQIENKMNGLKYTSFFLDTNYCRQSLSNQRTSLHDFKNELSHYEARMETMEDRIIGKLNSIECDC